MNQPINTPHKVALSLLVICLIAVVVGLFNAVRLQELQATDVKTTSVNSPLPGLLTSKNSLMLIELSGPIIMHAPQQGTGLFPAETNAMVVRKALDQAAENENIKGVLLHINSPGGTVAMSQELNAAVKRVRAKKPIVVSMGDVAASGGYYTACASDLIVVNPGTLTASIGVIIGNLNMTELFEDKLGVHAITIKSGKFKDLLSPYRKNSTEELALIQKLVDESYQDFLKAVIDGRTRNITDEQAKRKRIESIKAVADGRIVHGEQAVESGLADKIGDMEFAYTQLDKMAKERFGLKVKDRLPLERVTSNYSLWDFLGLTGKTPLQFGTQAEPSYMDMLPLSLRYPNQPLWVME